MSHPSSLPHPDFELAGRSVSDWAAVLQYVDGLPYCTDRSFAVHVLSEVDGLEQWLRSLVAAPDDVLALTVLGARVVRIGWTIRTTARAEHVSREQFAGLHAHLRQAEQLLIRATALDPSHDAPTTAIGLQLGQNEAPEAGRQLGSNSRFRPGMHAERTRGGHERRAGGRSAHGAMACAGRSASSTCGRTTCAPNSSKSPNAPPCTRTSTAVTAGSPPRTTSPNWAPSCGR
ncbi:hypothetical protein ABZZ74_46035 [Streptomyces sp. NPDC006476]|uniref:hypothetical protein n=1 Tax=Streptomyces sp. NPDC006476 TaxID=3157175 RepID=UPI0033BA75AD